MNNKFGIYLPLNRHLIPFPNHLDRPINMNNNNYNNNNTKTKFDKLSHEELLNINELNISNYKNKLSEIVYSEEEYLGNKKISYEQLLDIINIKESFPENNYKNFKYINYNINNNILFTSNFESGNLKMAIKHSDNEYDLFIRPESNSSKTFQWFYFLVQLNPNIQNIDQEKNIIKFNIINLSKKSIILNEHVRVLCYYNNYWSRDTFNIYFYPNNIPCYSEVQNNININYNYNYSPINTNNNENNNNEINENNNNNEINDNENNNNEINENNNNNNEINYFNTLTFSFNFSKIETDDKYILFSYCYPYTYSNLINFLSTLTLNNNILRFEEIGKTILQNPIQMLLITNFKDSFENIAKKQCILLTARVHPGESNSSFVIQGLIEFLLSNDTIAFKLRKLFLFKIIPMLNSDGVILGNFRYNSIGIDLNRMWNKENIEICPTIYYVHQIIQKTLISREIYFYCDFHGHSVKKNFFLYSCKEKRENNNNYIKYHELVFSHIFNRENIYFDKKSCYNKIHPSKMGTARAVMKLKYGIDLSYCLECSLGSIKLQKNLIYPFTIELYKKIGKDFCIALSKLINNKIYIAVLNNIRVEKKDKEILGKKKKKGKKNKDKEKDKDKDKDKEKEKDNDKDKEIEKDFILPPINVNNINKGNFLSTVSPLLLTRNKSEHSTRSNYHIRKNNLSINK